MEPLQVEAIKKTFRLSKKQRKIERTDLRKKVALDGVSFSANPGEIFGLLGPNGAGKTTALRCIATLIRPDEGDIRIGGITVRNHSAEIRRKIAFLTSDLQLETHFTPNYLFAYFSRLHKVPERTMTVRRDALFSRFGIDAFREVKVADLSTGMKQKTSLAISLVHDPPYIIFDEPTNGLDVLTAKTVTDYLIELKDAGKTIILSTHILRVVEKLCDRAAIIIDGLIKDEGTLEELVSKTPDGDLETLFFQLVEESEASDHV